MATIVCDALSGPVRVRNLSSGGALIEGAELPKLGARCRLRRGEMWIGGTVIRCAERTAALQFDHPICAENWLLSPNARQRQIDEQVQSFKHTYPSADRVHLATASRQPAVATAFEMLALADQIDVLADALSEDAVVVDRYAAKLQILDIASQRLRRLASG